MMYATRGNRHFLTSGDDDGGGGRWWPPFERGMRNTTSYPYGLSTLVTGIRPWSSFPDGSTTVTRARALKDPSARDFAFANTVQNCGFDSAVFWNSSFTL